MRLYVDDNLTDRRVMAQLQRAGHTVVLPAEVGHAGASDAQHFAQAIRHTAVILTRNYKDFIALHDLIRTAGGTIQGCSWSIWKMIQREI
jgi:predicted nuclease of predicted toxin-antitoxin system